VLDAGEQLGYIGIAGVRLGVAGGRAPGRAVGRDIDGDAPEAGT
jgi:hypothetical protein